jgi:hypothetical protein
MPREHERYPHLIEIVLESASGKREARIRDLSIGGCFIDSIAGVFVTEPISFVVKHDDGQIIEFSGEVTYIFPGIGFGVKFTVLSEDASEYLDRVISNQNRSGF